MTETVSELPPGVTETPQDEEHMDLSRVGGYRQWVTTYLEVSDDDGDLLGDKGLEAAVKASFRVSRTVTSTESRSGIGAPENQALGDQLSAEGQQG